MKILAAAILFAMGCAQAPIAKAIEIHVLSSNGVTAVLKELGPRFERATGNRLVIRFDTTNNLQKRIAGGESFDVAILTRQATDELAKAGKIAGGTAVDIARSGLGVAVRKGAPKPDISTLNAFKRSMLAAKSVGFSATGASGLYVENLFQRLGIAAEMKAKSQRPTSDVLAQMTARGDVEIALQQISEIRTMTGTDFVGPFPQSLQYYSLFAASVSADAKAAAARDFVAYLAAPAARTTIKANWMELP